MSCETLLKAINAKLPDDVCVREVVEVPQSFCANKDAVRKMYRYVIQDGRIQDPFMRKYAWFVRQNLDAEAMSAGEPVPASAGTTSAASRRSGRTASPACGRSRTWR